MEQIPLSERLRPKSLKSYLSQKHLVGDYSTLRQAIEKGIIPSLILYGPPGVGKTTLAQIIATSSKRPFFKLSAVDSGVKEIREVIYKAKDSSGVFTNQNPILFIDEIHIFSKSQQSSLLEAVEKGWVTLIAATTENPSFQVISALLSRCQVFTLKSLEKEDLVNLLHTAIKTDSQIKSKKVSLKETQALLRLSSGDARKLLNIFELIVISEKAPVKITDEMVLKKAQNESYRYDKTGEQHYDIASALIKSIRGSDPNASLYWLARMIQAGEDLKFISRRLIICASEDIGNANPNALILANTTAQAIERIGMPESRIILGQCVTYLASSPKSNACYLAIRKAQEIVKQTGDLYVPFHLRNAPTNFVKNLNYGKNYIYPHDYQNSFIQQDYLPQDLKGTIFYEPKNNQRENIFRLFLKKIWRGIYKY